MAVEWFYADARNQQQGPVPAAALASAYRDGTVTADSLVWREGLANWVPLRQVATQIGVMIVGAPPPPGTAPAGAARIVKPSGSSSAVIIVIVVGFGVLMMLGILAAIAVPAYQEYLMRAKVAEAVVLADGLKTEVAEFVSNENRCPSNSDTGFEPPESYASRSVASITLGERANACTMRLSLRGASVLDGKFIELSLGSDGSWHAKTDLPARYLPRSLREGEVNGP